MSTGNQWNTNNISSLYSQSYPNYWPQYPYGYYHYYPDETVTETEEVTEYGPTGKVIKKTVKRTTRTKPRSNYYWSQPYYGTVSSGTTDARKYTLTSSTSSGT